MNKIRALFDILFRGHSCEYHGHKLDFRNPETVTVKGWLDPDINYYRCTECNNLVGVCRLCGQEIE